MMEFDAAVMLRESVDWLHRNRERLPRRPGTYTRTLLRRTPSYEIVAMEWGAGAVSPIHDHGESRCTTLIVGGSLTVERFVRSTDLRHVVSAAGSRLMLPGDVESLRDDSELHRVSTVGEGALAVHLYARPLRGFTTFDERDGRIRTHRSSYDLVLAR
jgi:cysteine dioxygenase